MPIHRIAAFVKRLSTVSLNMPSKTVTSCLQLIRRLTSVSIREQCYVNLENAYHLTSFSTLRLLERSTSGCLDAIGGQDSERYLFAVP